MNKNSTKCAIMDICKTAFIVIFSITIIISVHAVPPATANVKAGVEHVVVFDAGSSGTRVHVFNLYKREDGGPLPVVDITVRSKQTLKVKPGLSAFAEKLDMEGTKSAMLELLDFANRFVPIAKRPRTPLLLKATAGLRAVKATSAEAVLEAVRNVFRKSEYQFVGPWVQIIPGYEEGGLSWVTANYLKGTFDPKANGKENPATHDSESDSGSIGVLELGGGSLQVTMQVDAARKIPEKDRFDFKIPNGRSYHVFAHSYLGFGQDYAQTVAMEKHADKNTVHNVVPIKPAGDPCYPKGYERYWSVEGCEASGTGTKELCADAKSKIVKGLGNGGQCYDQAIAFLQNSGADAPGKYSIPPLHGHFIAIENFWYVRNDLNLPMKWGKDERNKAIHKACETTTVAESNLNKPKDPKGCFALSYQNALIDTLKTRKENGAEVEIIHEINGADVDWALGAAIVHSIKKKSVIVVSDGIESYDTFKPTFMTVTFEMIGLIVAIAFLYMCFCRRLIFGFGKQGLSSSTDGIGNGILGSANKLV